MYPTFHLLSDIFRSGQDESGQDECQRTEARKSLRIQDRVNGGVNGDGDGLDRDVLMLTVDRADFISRNWLHPLGETLQAGFRALTPLCYACEQ